eukprot:Rmarinus@m.1540
MSFGSRTAIDCELPRPTHTRFRSYKFHLFLKNCDTGKRLKDLKQRVSNEAEGRLSSVQCVANRIASEPDREYIFRKETKFTYGSEEECPTEGEKELPGKDVTDNTEMPRRRRLRRNEDADSACVNELSISDEEHSDGGGGFFLPGHDSVPGENTNSSPAAPSARLISAASATGNDSPSHTPLLEKNAEWENNTVDEDVGGGFLECDRDDVSAVPPDHLEDSEMAGPDQNPPDSNVIQIQDFEGGIEKRGLGIVKPSSDLSDIRTLHSSGNIEVGEVVPPVQKSLGDARNGNDDVASNTKNEHDDADAASGVKSSNDDVVSDAKLTRKSGAENVSENEGDGSSVDWDETSNVSNSHDVQVSAEASQHGNDQLQMTSGAFESTDKQGGASGQDVSVMDALLSAMEAEVIADVKETAQSGIDGGKKLVSALEEGVRTEGNFEESFVHLLRKAATNNDGAIDLTDQPADATSPFSADVASVPIDVESSPVNATPTFPAEADSSSADVASVPIDVNSSTFDVAGMFSTGIAASDLDRPTEGAGSSGALDVTANGLGVEETMQKVDDAPLDDVELRDVAERQESLQKARAEIEIEVDALRRKEQKMQSTSSSGFSKDMLEETKQLLRLFGVPYIVSPMEAEAQCAYLEACNLVNGVVTEDSDCFLFGACDVYKNIFDEKKYVEVYKMRDLERELGVDREKLIHLAMLLGSDYTEGVRGVGIVNATEIVRAFPDRDRLKQFKEWVETFGDFGEENPEPNDPEAAIKRFKWTHRNMKRNWVIRPGFASDAIRKAYMEPLVDKSKETFQWGTPQLDALRELCRTKFLWSQTQADEYLLPVMQAAADRHTQMRIPNFFFSERFAKIRSSRMQAAVRGLAGDEHSAHLMSEPALKPLNKPPNPRKKRAPKPAKSAGAQTPEETTACSAPSPASTLAGETAVTRGGKRSSAVASRRAKKRPRVQSKTPPCSEGSAPDNGRSSELQSARALRRRGEASGDGDGDGGSSDSNRRSGGRSSGDDDFDPGACSSSGSSM